MATKRKRGQAWQYVVKRAGLLARSLYLTFDEEAEGDAYVGRLEALLDRGVVPPKVVEREAQAIERVRQKRLQEHTLGTVVPASGERRCAGGNHRGSIFRLLVDQALIARHGMV